MENLDFGQILLLIVFILLPLGNFVMQRVRRRLEDKIPAEESVTQTHRQAEAIATPPPTPRASRNRVHGSPAPTVSPPLSTSHFAKRWLVGAKGDVQRGIIIMTILGPCRAFDPPG
jgi:hypothetical protein